MSFLRESFVPTVNVSHSDLSIGYEFLGQSTPLLPESSHSYRY